ncbi:transposase [Dictyobacter formicarum]|uniref:Transposase n=1 Tax=Dictyobacter formicarum TaxID=2778368 RepID=A0ABQ3V8X9_9CHLR|nr:ISL3 family transposase [Dictyobacter formicarum]GHO82577.1 transposase [Dictyobacter formicarum]
MIITARALAATAVCPTCQYISHRVHSYYTRSPHDLPMSGQTVQLSLHVRRFRCQNQACQRQTFVERLPEVVSPRARRTIRLNGTLTLFAMVMSGQAGSRLLNQIGMVTSADTLLRRAKHLNEPAVTVPLVLGVDDFAFRRGRTYGTILVDLQTHRPIDLLPERTADALSSWLRAHPGVLIISRDRSTEYARGASDGAPQSQQVADRFHILKNFREAVERALKRLHASLLEQQQASGSPQMPRYKRRRSQTEIATAKVARLRRQARYEEVVMLYKQGMSILGIADQLRMSRSTVRNFVYAGAFPERATALRTKSLLDPYVPYLEQRWAQGCRNANQLWKEVVAQGFTGEYKVVNRWLAPRREKPGRKHSLREKDLLGLETEEEAGTHSQRMEPKEASKPVEPISLEAPRHLVWLLLRDPSTMDTQERRTRDFIRQNPLIARLSDLAQDFVTLMSEGDFEAFDLWLEAALRCDIPDVESFAQGLQKDYEAIKAALVFSYSNGPVEGHVNRLKYIKRSMYGRGSFELLRQRVLDVA